MTPRAAGVPVLGTPPPLLPDAALLPVVTVRDLRVAYEPQSLVLDGVDLTLHPGETVALLGSSGSGKSTLMKSLTGFAPITSGSVRVAGYDVTNLRSGQLRDLRADVGQVFQQFNLIGRLPVLTNVLTGSLRRTGPFNLVGGFSAADRMRALDRSTASASRTRRTIRPGRSRAGSSNASPLRGRSCSGRG